MISTFTLFFMVSMTQHFRFVLSHTLYEYFVNIITISLVEKITVSQDSVIFSTREFIAQRNKQ